MKHLTADQIQLIAEIYMENNARVDCLSRLSDIKLHVFAKVVEKSLRICFPGVRLIPTLRSETT
jgi:hypothetical protein